MATHAATVVIDRPIADVWAFVTDLQRTPLWRTTVRTVEPPARLGVGERFQATTKVLGRRWSWILEVSVLNPPNHLAIAVVEGAVPITVDYLLEPLDERCRFTLRGTSAAGNRLMRLLEPLAARSLAKQMDQHVENLRRRLET